MAEHRISAAGSPGSNTRDDALDGLRAIAIASVVTLHFKVRLLPGGWFGVDLFFVLSGFLITGIVTREIDRSGTCDLRQFYWRRALRLWPAFGAMLFGAVLLAPLVAVPRDGMAGAVLAAATFTMNWWRGMEFGSDWILGHSWSLAVEQQFYLLWPIVLLTVPRRQRVPVTALLVAAMIGWRCIAGWTRMATGC